MNYTEESKEAAADVLQNLAEHGDHLDLANWSVLMVMSMAIEVGFDDIRIDACTQREQTFRKRIIGYTNAVWVAEEITGFCPLLVDLHKACSGDINVFDQAVNWPMAARSWRGAALKLERGTAVEVQQ